MATPKGRGWTLLVIPDDESRTRQIRLPRAAVYGLISIAILVIVYAIVETVLFWMVAHRAALVEPLRQQVRELESSGDEVARLGAELSKLRSFEQQLRGILAGRDQSSVGRLPWSESSPLPATDGMGETAFTTEARGLPVVHGDVRTQGGYYYTAADVPTLPPVRGYITRAFITPKTYSQTAHYGLDLAVSEGTPVLAAADGLVVFASWTYLYGNLVVLAHRSGHTSFYGHNQILLCRAGDRVRQAEPIALAGSSGLSTAPHVHFELWQDGAPVDPRKLLRIAP